MNGLINVILVWTVLPMSTVIHQTWFCVWLANLLKTAVSVLASTVRLTVSFIEPLMTVSVMLRCSQQTGSSSILDLPQSF